MRQFIWITLALLALSTAVGILADNGKIQPEIIIQTPKKTSGYQPTKVVFNHARHASEYSKTCDGCHPVLAQKIDDPRNDKDTVHESCKICHDKDQPAKTFACNSCHIK